MTEPIAAQPIPTLDTLKELAALADQATPSAMRAVEVVQAMREAGLDVEGLVSFVEQALLLGARIADAVKFHDPDVESAARYSDGRPVTTIVALGETGSVYVWSWPADPDQQPEPQLIRAGGQLFQVSAVDGHVIVTPADRGSSDVTV